MAGSLKWFNYTDDFGSVYALLADESNVEAVNSTGDYTGTPVLVDALPRNVRPRFAVYQSPDEARNIKIPVLTPTTFASVSTDTPTISDPINPGQTLRLVRVRPETRRLPIPNDTGLSDGDGT